MAEPTRRRRWSTVATVVVLTGAACTAGPEPTAPTAASAAAPDRTDAVRRAVQATVDAVNAAAAGDVAAQQAVLARVVDPARAAEQTACAPATITIRIDPALDALTPLPGPEDAGGNGSATAGPDRSAATTAHLRLPALLEVYTGPIRTGTDLTGLEFTLVDGVAHTAPLCLR
ncbi:hypothetical protein [Nakamurella deserti]|uniref:hypothetical protein n=1 Tax=Nakamurella deserti TaxID=2164074 RepID=UPI000DBEA5FC|nr:hypothetical protein [Nakamurella deserti]